MIFSCPSTAAECKSKEKNAVVSKRTKNMPGIRLREQERSQVECYLLIKKLTSKSLGVTEVLTTLIARLF